ncbi:MAG: ABC transporter ATP-binding protein [Lachnospiraceae bacterium]|nr:ABC transporter ATP-binding protein [Lachnospiraceae bacterium]
MVSERNSDNSKRKAVEVIKLKKSLNNKTIINGVTIDVIENEIHAIIGPNGAGKTTLLRLIIGLLNIDSGLVNKFDNSISIMLENDCLYEKKTGMANIYQYGAFFNIDIAIENINKLAILMKIDDALNHEVATYSKGMKRKLSLLITLLRDTPIYILDEPTSGVDPESRVSIREILLLLKNEGKTIILTSHDLSEVSKISDTISFMKNGVIIETFANLNIDNLEDKFLMGERNNE